MRISSLLHRGEVFALGLLILSVAIFSSMIFLGDSAKLEASLSRINFQLIISLLGLAIVNYFFRALRFYIFARRIGVHIPFPRMFLYYIAGFSMSATPGKFGELVRLWLIRLWHGHSIERSLPLQIADRVADIIACVILCVAALGAFLSYWQPVLGISVLLLGGIILLVKPIPLFAAINLMYRGIGVKGRLFARVRRILRDLSKLFTPGLFSAALLLSLVGWFAECIALDLCIQAMTGKGSLITSMFVFTFSNLVGGLTFLPGGVGGVEVSMTGFLIANGIEFETAAAITGIIRVATLWFGTALGIMVFGLLVRKKGAAEVGVARRS
jgi:uncharacterized protein (TIRG00374 family)